MPEAWTIAASVLGGLLLIELLVQAALVRIIRRLFEQGPPFLVEHEPPDPAAEPVAFHTADGLTLRGCLYHHLEQPPRGVIIFCHEFGGNHRSALTYCQGLWNSGFDILAVDFRSQGDSDQLGGYEPLHWLTEFEVEDTLATIRYTRNRDELRDLPLGLFGISLGAGAALVAAARNLGVVDAIAVDGAYATDVMMRHFTPRMATLVVPDWVYRLIPGWHTRLTFKLVRWTSQLRRRVRYPAVERSLPSLQGQPVLFISGARDTYVLPEVTAELYQLKGAGAPAPWIVPRAKHNLGRQVATAEYDRRLVEFFGVLDNGKSSGDDESPLETQEQPSLEAARASE